MENVLQSLMKKRGVYRLSGTKANKLTKECLQTALTSLMREKPFESISVTELVRRSGVSRQSFYRNYRTKEDILIDMCRSMGEDLTAAMLDGRYLKDTYQWYYDLFLFMYENRETIEMFIKARARQEARKIFLPALHEIFQADSDEKYYQIIAYEGGVNQIIEDWFEEGMKKDISQMARLCDTLFGTFHRRLLTQSGRRDKTE